MAKKMELDLKMFVRAVSAGCAQAWRLDELVGDVFNKGDKKYKLKLRPGRTGNALTMAKSAGLALPGAEAAHRVFSEQNWQIAIDFGE